MQAALAACDISARGEVSEVRSPALVKASILRGSQVARATGNLLKAACALVSSLSRGYFSTNLHRFCGYLTYINVFVEVAQIERNRA